jgi:peptidyl-prolyl cis-trans isomerase A (cyclophilin A)
VSTSPRVFRLSTSLGDVDIELDPEHAPETCGNFIGYAGSGRLDGTSFYRVLGPPNQHSAACPVHVVQGGLRYDPAKGYDPARGLGPIRHESTAQSGLRHRDGVVTMGRFAPGETYGGFCVCIGDQPDLDHGGRRFADGQGAAAFGRVRTGMAIVRRIFQTATEREFVTDPVAIHRVFALD